MATYEELLAGIQPNRDISFEPSKDEAVLCHNRNIKFGHGIANGLAVSYFQALNVTGLRKLIGWNEGCHVQVSDYSLKSLGFVEVYTEPDVVNKLLVVGQLHRSIADFIAHLENQNLKIQGIDFVRVWNQYSCALFKAKDHLLFCKAVDLFVGQNGHVIVPFSKVLRKDKDWFEGCEAPAAKKGGTQKVVKKVGAYEEQMSSLLKIYDSKNPYQVQWNDNATLRIIKTYLSNCEDFVRFFQTELLPMAYDDASFCAFLSANVNEVLKTWDERHYKYTPAGFVSDWPNDYGENINRSVVGNRPNHEWETRMLDGKYGKEWKLQLEDYILRRNMSPNVIPIHSLDTPPRLRRNCPMIFLCFVRHRLEHGVMQDLRGLRKLNKNRMVKKLDDVLPGAIIHFLLEMVRSGKLVKQQLVKQPR